MSQKSMTTTTSFTTVSSDDSSNRPALSSTQSINNGDKMTAAITADSIESDQYLSAKKDNSTMVNQQRLTNLRLFPSPSVLPPPPPPPPPPQEAFHGELETINVTNDNTTNNHQLEQQLSSQNYYNRLHSNDSGVSSQFSNDQHDRMSVIYGTYMQPNNVVHQQQSNQHRTGGLVNLQQPLLIQKTSLEQTLSPSGLTNQSSSSPSSYQQVNNNKNHSPNQRSSTSSLDSSSSSLPLMPINVKGMLLHGLPAEEVLRNWLVSIKCEDYIRNFADHGYDINLVTRMTPQDLAAIGCKSPALRKKLILEIKKLNNIDDGIPEDKPTFLDKWLESLKLGQYYSRLVSEGFDSVEKVCKITWEDLEEIGITKLGHQKRLLLAIERVQKLAKLEEDRQNDNAIYDVHPNHRVSLNGTSENRMSTLSRVRSGLFQTRSGANLDHRGLPVAKVMPALKHVNNSILISDTSTNQQISIPKAGNNIHSTIGSNGYCTNYSNNRLSTSDRIVQPLYGTYNNFNGDNNNIGGEEAFKMSDLATTLKRNPPPLPPVRTNSLKFPHLNQDDQSSNSLNNNYDIQPIYDNNNSLSSQQVVTNNYNSLTTNSTSFLRTPKLGPLTATTNKMLTLGGHIQTISCRPSSTNTRTIAPIREAPLPPNQHQRDPQGGEGAVDGTRSSSQLGNSQTNNHFQPNSVTNNTSSQSSLMGGSSSLIGHQLASADEFPPPPPCQ